DHAHMAVTVIYNRLKKNGKAQKSLDILTDVCILLCGAFMLFYGGERCLKMMRLPGKLPMTGLRTWWQFLPIPLAGFLMTFDSILFLTGIIKPSETLFTTPDIDYSEQVLHMDKAGNIIAPTTNVPDEPDSTVKKEGDE
ncbi:MAG: TRAP transporter small permease, partial [Clostridia bacterium]